MHKVQNSNDPFLDAALLLAQARTFIKAGSDMAWVPFDSVKEMQNEIDDCVEKIRLHDDQALATAYELFLPSGALHEHATSNGWMDVYMELADKFDTLYYKLAGKKDP